MQSATVPDRPGGGYGSAAFFHWALSPADDLLTPVDVVDRPGQRGVGHQVDGQRGDVGRPDDPPDRQGGPELFAPLVEVVTEQLGGQWRVDEPGRDEVDPSRP
jgi:hypothetical protein